MKNLHFVGIGGIGMSALAAAAADLACKVSGSDRGAGRKENALIFDPLRQQGIRIFPQDGSRFHETELPDTVVYSTAIEEDNPDFIAAGAIPRMHRSELLRRLIECFGRTSIAVTGSCGKSTVTAYTAEALEALGADPVMISGALSKRFKSVRYAGNYRPGRGDFLVFEADESDKSLLNYGADYAIILNIATDHYDKAELARVFGEFLGSIRQGAVLTREVYEAVRGHLPSSLAIRVIDSEKVDFATPYALEDYQVTHTETGAQAAARFSDGTSLILPKTGRHMAVNALCIRALLEMLGFSVERVLEALSHFEGVWRRDDFLGKTPQGAAVYDDYAHNPEKILSCLRGMRERCPGDLYAVFQAHGFKPFGFMKDQLFEYMEEFLRPGDRFIMLEPFYAGGTTSFKPTAKEVHAEWIAKSAHPERFLTIAGRDELKDFLHRQSKKGDLIVVMGARDNSLNTFAASLTENNR